MCDKWQEASAGRVQKQHSRNAAPLFIWKGPPKNKHRVDHKRSCSTLTRRNETSSSKDMRRVGQSNTCKRTAMTDETISNVKTFQSCVILTPVLTRRCFQSSDIQIVPSNAVETPNEGIRCSFSLAWKNIINTMIVIQPLVSPQPTAFHFIYCVSP